MYYGELVCLIKVLEIVVIIPCGLNIILLGLLTDEKEINGLICINETAS